MSKDDIFDASGQYDDAAFDDHEYQDAADRVIDDLLGRVGEGTPRPRLEPTRRAAQLLGDPQHSFSVVHVTGTNGKTSTSRMIESILRAYGLRTGLLTSPHLTRLNERIVIDGVPVSNAALASNWSDIQPYLLMVDAELTANGEQPLTYFEALTVLAFAVFADAPVDVAVLEVGMGGEWDSTNVADGQVAVFTPIALDHTKRLGETISEIARTKAGIIKPAARVVSALQTPEALTEIRLAAEQNESLLAVDGDAFALLSNTVAVGGQVISVRGRAGQYDDLFLPLFGDHQAQNATLAIAAVESFLGDGAHPLDHDTLAEGLGSVTSPGRLQIVGTDPTVLVDAAHNPHGAAALAAALTSYFTFDHVVCVLGVLADKDARGIVEALDPVVAEFIVTESDSERSLEADALATIVVAVAGPDRVRVEPNLATAMDEARALAGETERGAALVAGSITLIGEVIGLAESERWMK
ncbi:MULTISPECIES: folylpolyglutamate synthase/dihydrofolate synthase family protein [unclassified Diaminobutyricimonas]|uniref:bifunctional folylpolyglutamate synthase/dihydrofolate synthase n=1 Tax=unclassified Diaminobutyricimonas TaxID=2643261 RepID=UPI0012F4F535|nr:MULTISPECIES: folylpolyglutamate synthase/dihydrofolate synthase family protein [unclassified Diaminobutyricimonas]